MGVPSILALCATVASATAIQIPILASDNQAPIQAETGHPHGSKPLVNSTEIQDLISGDRLQRRAKQLFEIAKLGEAEYNHPTRVIGSAGHAGTLDYIYETILQLGDYYDISNQSFPAVSGNVFESRLVLGQDVPKSAAPMGLTPPTKDKQPVHGDLVLVKNEGCQTTDFPETVAGNIAFIKRGVCPFGTKSENAGRAGAVAAVVYNYEKDGVQGTLGTPSSFHVATFGLSGEEADPIIKKLEKGKSVDGIAYIDAEVKQILTVNIVAQTTEGDPNNVVMLGAHSDSVAEGPGINDDGSGTISLLEVATQLTKFNVSNAVRFAWWAGEEEGLLGSDYYVAQLPEEENQKIRLFMDYDMMASPNFAYQIYNATNAANPNGSEELRDLYIDWYEEQGLNYTFIPFDGRSDYDGFIRNGIPGGGIATGAEGIKTKKEQEQFGGKAGDWYDNCYHQLCDDLGNVNETAWIVNTKLIAHSIATYARSFKGFPERTLSVSSNAYSENVKYHGSRLFI
ncbi:aminopeptidase-like protein Y [Aaosphaeria arxii CBS 175.79]|uniref:Peptide hydrolase n=1 Tax=Aaosphaeria arxii CBS 175.79 TaxID=1450172 RepID=A0A6A5Y3R6_9PLEO|nr:aminopeptidase-like protein Y [Aaosphaeria arxii CBS 175.79]KAF2019194.1 aminopeptidase-like protein Y [Aaosphaeria arxii CBS 175.79]